MSTPVPEATAKIMRQLYPDTPTNDLAKQLGFSLSRVYQMAARMGLRKSEAYMASAHSARIQRGRKHPKMIASQFVKGHKTWNTGLKGWQAGGRSAQTQFKPGQVNHNAQPIGSYRVVRHRTGSVQLQQKTSTAKGSNDKRWTPVSRLVWIAAHGPVPAGSMVVFRPGQHTTELEQITLDKLELITRAQNAQRNHPRNKHPELAKLCQLKGAITRQVNRITREHAQEAKGATP